MPPKIYVTEANRPPRNLFNLSYDLKTTADMGMIIPVMMKEAIPGDVWDIRNAVVARLMPLVAPVLHRINLRIDYAFVPYRLLWADTPPDDWESFITGGDDGAQSTGIWPTWNPATKTTGSLWDYMTFPVGITPADRYPSAMPARAYSLIWNEFFRSQELQSEITIDLTGGVDTTDYAVKKRNWQHDYYSSALLDQQRGTAPALPITGSSSAVWSGAQSVTGSAIWDGPTAGNSTGMVYNSAQSDPETAGTHATLENNSLSASIAKAALDNNTVDLSGASTFDIASLRLAIAQQKYLELNNRAGARHAEYIYAHYGVDAGDARLQRPEWIGATTTPISISEVLQTSEDGTTPQGTMKGHGITFDAQGVARYRVKEWGIIMGLMTIMPEPAYQQGVDREWIKETRYDFYSPEFAYLSDQIIEEVELKASATGSENTTLFGYIGAWDQYRISHNKVTGYMRSGSSPDFSYWHLARNFTSRPALNSDFIEMDGIYSSNPSMKRIFAVQDEQSFVVEVGNILKVARPLPFVARPGGLS